MTTETAAKKDIQKLQRIIVDALEDVKAQEIVVFDTEKLTAMFERVIIASGTSNRQTRALAMSVRDAVNKAGFGKPRVEGEDNGEWIIVDCGAAVVHVMQPAIRSYYNLEELWGETPVRLKFGAEKVAAKKLTPTQESLVKSAAKPVPATLRRSSAAKTGVAEAFPSKAAMKKEAAIKSTKAAAAKKIAAKTPAAKKAAAKTAAKTATKASSSDASIVPAVKAPAAKKVAVKAPAKVATKVAAKKAPAKKVAAKKA
ncbi:MAG: ribosome silencing factor [Burkholderiaceae bacterium]|nr:ribosome silencing factor [Burkholderiaceae bacterium]